MICYFQKRLKNIYLLEEMNYKDYIESIKDFPKKGILYRDIQPLLETPVVFDQAIEEMYRLLDTKPKYWVGIESRGFIFASALSIKYGGGLKLIRKHGKLPNQELKSVNYNSEYETDTIEMKKGYGDVIIVDDVYATGGTITASSELCEISGYTIIGKICLLDIGINLDTDVQSLIHY